MGSMLDTIAIKTRAKYTIEAFRDGKLLWREEFSNLVPTVGLNDMLDKYWKGSAYTAAHYVGLASGTPTPAAGDTMASHGGWTEVTAYDEATREALVLGTVSGAAVDNSASRAEFTISTNATTIGGAFISTDATKGGTTGVLVSIAAFNEGNRTLNDNDLLRVLVEITAASA